MRARHTAIKFEMERFRALAEDRQPDFDAHIEGYAGLKQDQMAIFINQQDTYHREKDILQSQLDQQLAEEQRLTTKEKNLDSELKLLTAERKTMDELYKKGLSTRQGPSGHSTRRSPSQRSLG